MSRHKWLVSALIALTAASGAVAGGNDDGSGEVVADGKIVGRVTLRAPQQERFQLRAVLPVPPTAVRSTDKPVPLAVVGHDGLTVPTQVNVVTRYPDAPQGAAVVEVVAEVERPPGADPGDELFFDVAQHSHPPGKMKLKRSVRDMLGTPGGLLLHTKDVFGNVYTADLFSQVLAKDRRARTLRKGNLVTEYAMHEILLPKSPQGGSEGTLNHMMGVHAYVTTYAKREFFSLDLHVHNGMDGLDKDDPVDDAMRELYFEHLTLRVPKGWKAAVCFPSPTWGGGSNDGDWNHYALVEARPDGKLHYIPRQARFVRRLVVFREDAREEALATLAQENLGFCVEGDGPAGNELWSWWNADTARFLSQAHRLPNLDHVGKAPIRAKLAAEFAECAERLADGSPGGYPLESGVLGWAQPWGVPYGGMTGGNEIMISDGVETAYAASRDGYRLAQLRARCYIDRQPSALYTKNGEPTSYENLLVTEGFGAPYVDGYFFLLPNGGSDPFGFNEAPTFQSAAAQKQGRVPPYQASLSGWMPIDFQHYIRYTRSLKVLAWLGNDTLAKGQIEHAAEMFRLSFHPYANTAYGHVQGSGLLARELHVQEFPGQGLDFQRGEGWGVDVTVAAYALSDGRVRDRYYPWFQRVARVVAEGQSTCSGNLMASPIGKLLDGKANIRLVPHSAFAENSIQGMRRHVFEGRDRGQFDRLGDVILGSATAQISGGFWNEAWGAPYYYVGTGLSGQKGEFCFDIPNWAKSSYGDGMNYYSSLAYAYELSGDEEFLFRAAQMLGGGDLETQLLQDGTNNLCNQAVLLATVQEPPTE